MCGAPGVAESRHCCCGGGSSCKGVAVDDDVVVLQGARGQLMSSCRVFWGHRVRVYLAIAVVVVVGCSLTDRMRVG